WLGRKLPPAPQKPWLDTLQKLGPISLLLSWVPIVGDALCGVAGWLRWSWLPVLVYLSIGKILRYLAIYFLLNS
ncbi:MAG: DedA family protein, partial [Deefgea sp.]